MINFDSRSENDVSRYADPKLPLDYNQVATMNYLYISNNATCTSLASDVSHDCLTVTRQATANLTRLRVRVCV